VAVSAINVTSHPRAWVGITLALAAAAAFALGAVSLTTASPTFAADQGGSASSRFPRLGAGGDE